MTSGSKHICHLHPYAAHAGLSAKESGGHEMRIEDPLGLVHFKQLRESRWEKCGGWDEEERTGTASQKVDDVTPQNMQPVVMSSTKRGQASRLQSLRTGTVEVLWGRREPRVGSLSLPGASISEWMQVCVCVRLCVCVSFSPSQTGCVCRSSAVGVVGSWRRMGGRSGDSEGPGGRMEGGREHEGDGMSVTITYTIAHVRSHQSMKRQDGAADLHVAFAGVHR